MDTGRPADWDALLQGDSRAWERFRDQESREIDAIVRFTLTRTQGFAPPEEVESIREELFAHLAEQEARALRSYEGRAGFRTWLRAVAVRWTLNRMRAEGRHERRRESLASADALISAVATPYEQIVISEVRDRVRRAVEALPPRERLLIQMIYFDGLPYRAAAQILNLSINSISPTIDRALDKLMKTLQDIT